MLRTNKFNCVLDMSHVSFHALGKNWEKGFYPHFFNECRQKTTNHDEIWCCVFKPELIHIFL